MAYTKVIGILGGMGPAATLDLFEKIIEAAVKRGARRDQDHPEVVISSVPRTPDRTKAILGHGPSPEADLIRSARRLETAGADLIAIPCNSAHFFLEAIQNSVSIPILNMIELTVQHIVDNDPGSRKTGILATDGTIEARLYQDALDRARLEFLVPDPEHQRLVMDAIYGSAGVKENASSSAARIKMAGVAEHLIGRGAQCLIAGCTEIPLCLKSEKINVPIIDATLILANAAVDAAR